MTESFKDSLSFFFSRIKISVIGKNKRKKQGSKK
jgi:hypothetical protein